MVSLLAINSLRGACRRVPARGTVLGVRLLATNASGEARLASSLRGLSPTSSIASTTQLLGRTRALGPCCRCSCLAVTPPAVERTLQKRAYNTDREPEAKPVAGQQQSGADDSRQEMRDANGIVGVFNRSIYSAPVETFFSIMGMEIVTIYGIHLVLKASGYAAVASFSLASCVNGIVQLASTRAAVVRARLGRSVFAHSPAEARGRPHLAFLSVVVDVRFPIP